MCFNLCRLEVEREVFDGVFTMKLEITHQINEMYKFIPVLLLEFTPFTYDFTEKHFNTAFALILVSIVLFWNTKFDNKNK